MTIKHTFDSTLTLQGTSLPFVVGNRNQAKIMIEDSKYDFLYIFDATMLDSGHVLFVRVLWLN